jgi:dTMP kinase
MHPNPGPGKFIVVEGLDGAGTTTQIRLLEQRLSRSRSVYVTHEPSDGPVGLQIRMVLEHRVKVDPATLAALFAADRMDHLYHTSGAGGIVAHLERGTDVLTDRYYLSSFAYQGMNLDWGWIWDMHQQCIRPDKTIFVDVPVDVCMQRIAAGRGGHFDLFENKKALTHARQSYLRAIDRLCQEGEDIRVLDGNAPPASVHEAIWQEIVDLYPFNKPG